MTARTLIVVLGVAILLVASSMPVASSTGMDKFDRTTNQMLELIKKSWDSFKFKDNLYRRGKELAAKNDDLEEALPYFRTAIFFEPAKRRHWTDAGATYLRLASAQLSALGLEEKARANLVDAITALEMSVYLGGRKSKELLESARAIHDLKFKGKCASRLPCSVYDDQKQVMEKLEPDQHVKAVKLICKHSKKTKSKSRLRVKISPDEMTTGILSLSTLRWIFVTLRVCGVVVLPKIFRGIFSDKELGLKSAQEALIWDEATALKHLAQSDDIVQRTDVASREGKRMEVKLPLRHPFTSPKLISNPFVAAVTSLMLTENNAIDTFSFVVNYPGGGPMSYHSDVNNNLFEALSAAHPSPPGLVVALPVQDMSAGPSGNGPTEFRLGSHVKMHEFDFDYWIEQKHRNHKPPTKAVKIEAEVGDAVIFDIRTAHRGTENNSNKPRSIFYISYVCSWFVDSVNFKEHQSSHWDKLDFQSKRRLRRVDAKQFVNRLKDEVKLYSDVVHDTNSKSSVMGTCESGQSTACKECTADEATKTDLARRTTPFSELVSNYKYTSLELQYWQMDDSDVG